MDAVFFDFDETILDRRSSLVDFVTWQTNEMLRSEVKNTDLFIERFLNLDANGTVWKDVVYSSLVSEFSVLQWTSDELLTSYESCFSRFCKPKAGVVEAIKALHARGYKIGLISNGKSPFQERNFNSLGISELFDTVIISDAVGHRKPEIEIFNLACDSINVEPANSIMIGDNPKADIDGANLAGLYTIYVPSYHGGPCDAANACCNDYSKLVGLVEAARYDRSR